MAERGFTLIELLIVVVMVTILGSTVLTVGRTIHDRDRLSSAYAQDLSGIRRAARTLRDDLCELGEDDELSWRLDGRTLLREDIVVARNIQAFTVVREGAVAHVQLTLAARADAPSRREARIAFAVRSRVPGASR